MSNKTIYVTFECQAKQWLNRQTTPVQSEIIGMIKAKAPYASKQMIVISWTEDMSYPHIERAMKNYRWSPGIRVLFHMTATGFSVDQIDWRDCEPYKANYRSTQE